MRRSTFPQWLGLGAMLVVLVVVVSLDHLERRDALQEQREHTTRKLDELRVHLQLRLENYLQLARSLAAYVSVHPNLNQETFAALARELERGKPLVINLAIARDNIITDIYPRQGNQSALGLNLTRHPQQRGAVLYAMRTGHSIIAGPLPLVQKGEAFIGRAPVFIADKGTPGGRRYWGVVSVVINAPGLLKAAGADALSRQLDIAIRGKDSMGEAGDIFYGDRRLPGQDPVRLDLPLPGGGWCLFARPSGGWSGETTLQDIRRLFGILFTLMIGLLAYALARQQLQLRHMALHDTLTGLANRTLLENTLAQSHAQARRSGRRIALLYMDLDNFKPINDRYGHPAGDRVLIEVARRLQGQVRESDLVTRVGGDEFVVVLTGIATPADATRVADKLVQVLSHPIPLPQGECRIGTSIGIHLPAAEHIDVESALSRADMAMYEAKKGGKNRWWLASEAPLGT